MDARRLPDGTAEPGEPVRARLDRLAWWRETVGRRLPFDVPPEVAFDATAVAVVESDDLRERPLGELLPGLPACAGAPSERPTSVRTWNVLRRSGFDAWPLLAECSARELLGWQQAGAKVVTELVGAALEAWADLSLTTPDGAGPAAAAEEPHPFERARGLLASLCETAYRDGAVSVREALELAAQSPPDSTLGDLWGQLGSVRLDRALGRDGDDERAWRELLTGDARALRILAARRFALGRRATLDELGRELGVTRERVRQLEGRAAEDVERALSDDPACAPLLHRAARLRRTLGVLAPTPAVEALLREAVPDEAEHAGLRRGILLDVAGPYRAADGFHQLGSALPDLRAALVERAEEPWTDAELERLLEDAGVALPYRRACLATLPLHRFGERRLTWTGSLADKACRLLSAHGEPMSRAELHAAMGGERNLRSLLQQVQGDARVRRLGRDSYGLAAWDGEEYTTIRDEIEQALERRGGRAPVSDLVDELVERFGVSPNSVRAYAYSRHFVRAPDGTIVRAPDGHVPDEVPHAPAELDRDLVWHRGAWAVRVTVDAETRRGSGRLTRVAVAQAAGLRPGQTRTIELHGGPLRISWQRDQPALGSVRAFAEGLACEDGDLLFLPLRDDETVRSVPRAVRDAADGLARVALELGLRADAALAAVATAVGLPADATGADVRTRLRARRQEALAALVPSDPRDDALLIDELIGLGE